MILGINDGHNSSISLFNDGKTKNNRIEYAISEERITRIKNIRGFPKNSINAILNYYETEITDKKNNFDLITVGGKFRKNNRLNKLKEFSDNQNAPLLYFDHHLCHTSLYKLNYDFKKGKEYMVITLDGAGDGLSSTVSIAKNNKIDTIAQSDNINSIGDIYASFTELLGFKPMEDEGKVMGLAGYQMDSEHNETYEKILSNVENKIIGYNTKTKTFKNYLGVIGNQSTKELEKLFKLQGICNFKNMDLNNKVIISKIIQRKLEETVKLMVENFVKETGISDIVLSGGVAQNVKLNMEISDMDCVNSVYVPPFPSDEGLSIGSCILASSIHNKSDIGLQNTYLGNDIENSKIDNNNIYENNINNINNNNNISINNLSKFKITNLEENEIPDVIANLLMNNKIICVCRGRMEFGPRALGNRSIIALPTRENAQKINRLLNRYEHMPYAPTILWEYASEYVKNPFYSPHMAFLFKTKDNYDNKSNINGVIHQDGTTRPQMLKKEYNTTYYEIIRSLGDNFSSNSQSCYSVLNTSFNLHGEPIVCSLDDAVHSFVGDALLLGNLLIEKL
ncbi:carbamoyltransferase C-terminal domain-containing protein [Methanococcus voltae]|uniref:Carbamoyltransferase n=1 Tax=Methanococcus voltae (strain ATCC BAA-1334 / A3) TaxID=456320 RepID=D7DTR2_METV3|nr:carbamoyltransferase C-terminal domain-containing protein [Methanococcus voltae]MCS3901376.1 carbamoyltransferase [Methanococcus voltae]